MKENLSRILWGAVLIVVGVIWGINALGIADIHIFFAGWWTLFLIVPSLIDLVDFKKEDKTFSFIVLIVGILLLLSAQNIMDFDIVWKLLLPVILVCIGISFMFGGSIKKKLAKKIESIPASDGIEVITATFSENNVTKDGKFEGANLDSVFGGIKLDLRDAELKDETVIKASSIFAGIDILVPNDVAVKVKSTSIFGGVSNKVKGKDAKKTIYIDALCLFGGIDIK